MLSIIKKELRTYFFSMSGYIFLGFLILLTAIYFSMINVLQLSPNYYAVLNGTTIVFLILIPTLTMRLFADEARQHTDQLLYTSPLNIFQIVLGKYMAALSLFIFGMAITLIFPLVLSRFGALPVPQITSAYIGFTLLGACFISVGLFISVLTDNQIVAAVATFAVIFLFYIMSSLANSMPVDRVSSFAFIGVVIAGFSFLLYDSTKNIAAGVTACVLLVVAAVVAYLVNNLVFDGIMVKTLNWFSLLTRFENFNKGLLSISDIVYYVSFPVAFIYLTINVIEKRRWR